MNQKDKKKLAELREYVMDNQRQMEYSFYNELYAKIRQIEKEA